MSAIGNINRNLGTLLVVGGVMGWAMAAQAAEGKAVLDDWVEAADVSPIFDLSYGLATESGTLLDVENLELSVSGTALLMFVSRQIGFETPELEGDSQVDVSYTITVPNATFDGLMDEGDHYSYSSFEADTVEVVSVFGDEGSSTQTVKGAVVKDSKLAKWPAITDSPDKPISKFLPLIRAMLDVSFTSITVESIETVSNADGDIELTQSYGPLMIGATVRGDITAMAASNFNMAAKLIDTDEPLFEFTADSLTAREYNYGSTVERFLAPTDPAAGYETSLGHLEMSGMAFSAPEDGSTGTFDKIELSEIGVRPPSVDVFAMIDRMVLDDLSTGDEPSQEELIGFMGAAYGAFSLGRFELAGLQVEGGDGTNVALGSIFLSDLSAAGLGAFGMNGFDALGPDGEVIKLGEYALEDMTFPSLEALIGLESAIESEDVPAILAAIPTLGRVVQNDVVFSLPEENVDFAIGSSVFEMFDHVGPIPTGLRLGLDGFRFDLSALEPEEREPFDGLGLESLVVTSDMLVQWQRETGNVNLDFLAAVEQLGTLSAEGIVGNIPAIVFDQPDRTSLFALTGATLNAISLRFDDEGLVERAIAMGAEDEGIEYGAMELRVKGMIPVILSELNDATLANELADGLTAVIERGASLTISAVAPSPLPLVVLGSGSGGPGALASMFEIEVSNP
ncbi:MAG: hypothetical protein AAFR71_02285 [Pseudomonadota bacterium]